ncbi:hypothetical protein PROFUN_15339 [Planoprotostelium fungivorum]|uniref:Uncharacterized protein n=1 Tax=Planoprotostelium fungivorum TaxID=1890364 RepID=A0A2P6MWU8_9EUKA|nr:hypothetical protein PROFUN_15339 [Planoprotostelium fungivorum]
MAPLRCSRGYISSCKARISGLKALRPDLDSLPENVVYKVVPLSFCDHKIFALHCSFCPTTLKETDIINEFYLIDKQQNIADYNHKRAIQAEMRTERLKEWTQTQQSWSRFHSFIGFMDPASLPRPRMAYANLTQRIVTGTLWTKQQRFLRECEYCGGIEDHRHVMGECVIAKRMNDSLWQCIQNSSKYHSHTSTKRSKSLNITTKDHKQTSTKPPRYAEKLRHKSTTVTSWPPERRVARNSVCGLLSGPKMGN